MFFGLMVRSLGYGDIGLRSWTPTSINTGMANERTSASAQSTERRVRRMPRSLEIALDSMDSHVDK